MAPRGGQAHSGKPLNRGACFIGLLACNLKGIFLLSSRSWTKAQTHSSDHSTGLASDFQHPMVAVAAPKASSAGYNPTSQHCHCPRLPASLPQTQLPVCFPSKNIFFLLSHIWATSKKEISTKRSCKCQGSHPGHWVVYLSNEELH